MKEERETMLKKVYDEITKENRDKENKLKRLLDDFTDKKNLERKAADIEDVNPPDFTNSIPPPPIFKKSDVEKMKDLNKTLNKQIPLTGWTKANVFFQGYAVPLVMLLLNLVGFGLLFILRDSMGYFFMVSIIFYGALFTPMFLGIAGYMLLRFFMFDRNRLTGIVIKNVSKNFIIANFFLTQKRIIQRVSVLNPDGISFSIGDCVYIVDREEVWIDSDNHPNGYWLPNMPNQLKIDFATQLLSIMDGKNDANKPEVTYSSKNLKVFMKDKIFYEFHNQMTPEAMKLLYVAFGAIGLLIVAIIIIVAVNG
jgi:hypothetical protein